MTDPQWFARVSDTPDSCWADTDDVPIDRRKRFRQFRDVVEGGETFVLISGRVIASGYVSSPASGLFSDPWKLWSNDQFLRLGDPGDSGRDGDSELVSRRDALLRRLIGAATDPTPVNADLIHARLGGCVVVRGLDSSELFPAGGGAVTTSSAGDILAALQSAASRRGLGVAFPYVDRHDAVLLDAARRAGFVFGAVTATNVFELPTRQSFDDLLRDVPGRVRYRFRKEWKDFHAAGYTLHELDLQADVHEVVDLETRNRAKHGGPANITKLTEMRLAMAHLLAGNLRTKGVRDADGNLVACGVDVVDERCYLGIVYGQDDDRVNEFVYPTVVYSWPLRFAVEQRIPTVRMGFEAFGPKALRGGRVDKRVFAFWHPDDEVRATAARLLALLDERLTRGVLSRTRTPETSSRHWSFLDGEHR
jgi:hypothetical protein